MSAESLLSLRLSSQSLALSIILKGGNVMFEEGNTEGNTQPAPRRHGAPGVTGAILLIAVGVIILLNNLDILSVNLLSLLRFWPIILILMGLDIILGRHSALGSLIVAVIAIVAIGGLIWMVGINGQWAERPGETITRDVAQELGDVRALELGLDVGLMETRLEALNSADRAVRGTYRTNFDDLGLDVDYRIRGDTGLLNIRQEGHARNVGFPSGIINQIDLGLTSEVAVDIVVNAGVGESVLDLTGINLSSLEIHAGVGSLTVILPAEGDFSVDIDAGVGGVDLTIPESLEAHIQYDGGLSSLDAPDRFDKIGDDVWVTENYSDATNRALIKVSAGIGSINVHD
ncbi:MAG: hypothetical protein JXB30_06975 [Anaerolineae bacterium]|nr:hypothetical protein [Anaerolineae bacterium]